MGKRGRRFNKGPRQHNGQRTDSWVSYSEREKKHEKLQKYYDELLQLPEDEKEQFWEAFRRDLPNSFRFAGSKGKLLVDRYLPEIVKITHADGRTVEAPKPVPWYPNELAWSMTTPKNIVRKFAPFSAFQKFLVSETSIGNISRQEVVSMIPPLVMDVRPGMAVLDMCASPGSKATQLLEMVHRGEEARIRKALRAYTQDGGQDVDARVEDEEEDITADLAADSSDDGRATGMLIANDTDYRRCHMLVHQLKRLSSPNMIVTNHDATMFPSIKIGAEPENPDKPRYLKFDRILADVPCSGDGTLRKNINLWAEWNPNSALGLHNTQIRILVRALSMLKPGGRVVYSTCSMNPVENEAVISAAIDRCGGSDKVEIVDCANELPQLKRKPGLKTWSVMDKGGRIWNNMQEVKEFMASKDNDTLPGKVLETMFPLPEGSENAGLPLERCMRVYAHLQDTGGFFITVLHKKAELKVRAEEKTAKAEKVTEATKPANENGEAAQASETTAEPEAASKARTEDKEDTAMDVDPQASASNGTKRPAEDAAADEDRNAKKAKLEEPADSADTSATPKSEQSQDAAVSNSKPPRNRHGQVEEPFKYLSPDHPVLQDIKSSYTISDKFPQDRFMVRNATGDPAKAIYYTSQLVKDVLVQNEGRAVKFVHAGVKMFMKQDVPSQEVCRWRIQSEGLPIVQGYVGEERVVRLRSKETLRKLLIEMFFKIKDDAWRDLGEIGERVRDLKMGCAVLRVEPDGSEEGGEGFQERMALPLWKSVHSLNLMLPKEDRTAMLLRIFNDTTPLVNNALTKEKQAKVDAAKQQQGQQQDQQKDGVKAGTETEDDGRKDEPETAKDPKQEDESKAEVTAQDDADAVEDVPSPPSD